MAAMRNEAMAGVLGHNWWMVLVRGVAAVLFGILAFVWPGITLLTLIILFGIYALIDGIFLIARAFTASERGTSWIWPTLGGVVSIIAGILAFVRPGLTALVLLYVIGAWAVINGVSEIVAGIGLRHEIAHEWLLVLGGAISVIFGVLLLARPSSGLLAVVWLIGFYAIVIGVTHIALAFRVRDWQEHPMAGTMPGTMPPAAA